MSVIEPALVLLWTIIRLFFCSSVIFDISMSIDDCRGIKYTVLKMVRMNAVIRKNNNRLSTVIILDLIDLVRILVLVVAFVHVVIDADAGVSVVVLIVAFVIVGISIHSSSVLLPFALISFILYSLPYHW